MNKVNVFRLAVSAAVLLLSNAPGTRAEIEAPAALPVDYVDEAVTNVGGTPTGLALTPDGRLLIARQNGNIRVFKNGALLPTAALDLTVGGTVCTTFERGIESVAVDPNFASNNYIYVYYTYAGSDNTCTDSSDEINRVARYTMNGDVAQAPLVILDNIESLCGNHNGGSLNFGADGKLYISTGDGGCDSGTAQNRNMLNGKILRINSDGSIPADNPYVNTAGSVACAATAANPSGGFCREIYAYGLRNPFKTAFKHNSNLFHINDVGQGAWEEISVGAMGANYGWNVREGFCASGSTTNCGAPPSGMTNPIYAYDHSGLCSITGGAFSTNVWSNEYADAYYFADWCARDIFRLVPGSGGSFTRSVFHTSPAGGGISELLFDPAGKALYYAQGGGPVRRIRFTGGVNRAPTAVASVSINYGAVPFTAQFSSAGSSDPDGDPLTYGWTFGDGSALDSSANPSHTYVSVGPVTATLVVTDSAGLASTPATVALFPGNTPPDVAITAPNPAFQFTVGQPVTLVGTASDAGDGTLPPGAVQWSVLLWHVSQANPGTVHSHPFYSGSGYTLTIPSMPPPEDLDAAALSYLELRLTATDQQGLARTVTQTLTPSRVAVGLATQPTGLMLTANNTSFSTNRQIIGWQGQSVTLSAPVTQSLSGARWRFERWSDGGAQTRDVVVASSLVTYTAVYTPDVQGPNTPPDAAITSPNSNFRFVVGKPVTLTATATDAQDGTLPGNRLQWLVRQWHVPQILTIAPRASVFFTGTGTTVTIPSMPPPENLDAAARSYVEVQLTATDLQGLTRTVTQTLTPSRVAVTLASQPNGLSLKINEASISTTRQITGWQGMTLTLSAPGIQQPSPGNWLLFARWSNSGAATHNAFVPATAVTYTAVYTPFVPSFMVLPIVRRN